MAINQFSYVPEQPILNTYVPLPYEELAATGAAKQRRYDLASQKENELADLIGNVKALKEVSAYGQTYKVGDYDYTRDYLAKLNKELGSKAEEIASGDKGARDYQNWLSNKAREVRQELTTGKLADINQAYGTYQAQQKSLAEAKDLALSDWRANQIYKSRAGYGQVGGALGDAQLSLENVGEYVDRNKELNESLQHIKGIGRAWAQSTGNYINEGSLKEVPVDKIVGAFDNWFNNSKTRYDIEQEANYRVQSGLISPEQAQEFVDYRKKQLENEAVSLYYEREERAGKKADPYGVQTAKQQMENPLALPQTFTTEKTLNPNINTEIIDKLSEMDFDSNGSLKPTMNPEVVEKKFQDPTTGKWLASGIYETTGKKGIDLGKTKQQVELVTSIMKENPQLAVTPTGEVNPDGSPVTRPATHKEVMERYSTALKNAQERSYNVYDVAGMDRKALSDFIVNTLQNRSLTLDNKEKGLTMKNIFTELGLSAGELSKALVQAEAVGIVPVSGNNAGSYQVTIRDSKGVPRTITAEGSKEQQAYFKLPMEAYELEKQGKTGSRTFVAADPVESNLQSSRQKKAVIVNKLYKASTQIRINDENGQPEFQTLIYDPKSQVYSPSQTDAFLAELGKRSGLGRPASRDEADKAGFRFDDEGGLINMQSVISPLDAQRLSSEAWNNSPYNIPFQKQKVKNPITYYEGE